MNDPNRESDRLPQGGAYQSIDHWAQHGVEELTEREAEEQAELGRQQQPADDDS